MLASLNRTDDVVAELQRVYALNPNDVGIRLDAAASLARLGRDELARQQYQAALDRNAGLPADEPQAALGSAGCRCGGQDCRTVGQALSLSSVAQSGTDSACYLATITLSQAARYGILLYARMSNFIGPMARTVCCVHRAGRGVEGYVRMCSLGGDGCRCQTTSHGPVLSRIANQWLGESVALTGVKSLHGGSMSTTLLLQFKRHKAVVLKIAPHMVVRQYQHEAYQLNMLRDWGLPCPEVYASKLGDLDDPNSYLLIATHAGRISFCGPLPA